MEAYTYSSVCVKSGYVYKAFLFTPNGEKKFFGKDEPNIFHMSKENLQELMGTGENPFVKRTIYFISIRFGEGKDRMAILHKTVYDANANGSKTYTIHKYKGSYKALLTTDTNFEFDANIEKKMLEEMKDYNKTLPVTIYRQEDEYTSGHRMVDQTKIVVTIKY